MLINFIGGTSQGSFHVDSNELSLEILKAELARQELNFTVDDNTIVNYSYRTEAGKNSGELTENTVISVSPTSTITITQQMRQTKARAYSTEELVEVIAEAKAALVSQEYKALRQACRELSQVNQEVKELIGNYTHYTVSSLVDAVERAVKFLSPEVTEVSNEDLEVILGKINAIELKVDRIVNEASGFALIEVVEELGKVREDLIFVANHFQIMLPNHKEAFVVA